MQSSTRGKNRIEVAQKWFLSTIEFESAVDLVSFYVFPIGEYKNLKDWKYNLKSQQYRLFNNKAFMELCVYYFRTDQNNKMRIQNEKLLKLLDKN